MTIAIDNVSRRQFLGSSAGLSLGLTLGFRLGGAQAASPKLAAAAASTGPAFEPNAFLRIGADNSVTVISKHLEMGQGTYTGLATLAAALNPQDTFARYGADTNVHTVIATDDRPKYIVRRYIFCQSRSFSSGFSPINNCRKPQAIL